VRVPEQPTLTRAEFYEFLAASFGLTAEAAGSKARFLIEFERLLLQRSKVKDLTALVIDEAQSLSLELMEEVRLLANLESLTDKLLPVVMAGQPELADMLDRPELRHLKQRVALRADLAPLGLKQVAHTSPGGSARRRRPRRRLHEGSDHLDSQQVFRHSRTISVVCDNAMLAGYAAGVKPIGPDIIEEVSVDFRLRGAGQAGATAGDGLRAAGRTTRGAATPGTRMPVPPVVNAARRRCGAAPMSRLHRALQRATKGKPSSCRRRPCPRGRVPGGHAGRRRSAAERGQQAFTVPWTLDAPALRRPQRGATYAASRVGLGRDEAFGGVPSETSEKLVTAAATGVQADLVLAIEQYRKLAAILHHAQGDRGLKLIMVTSANPGEGKTLTASIWR